MKKIFCPAAAAPTLLNLSIRLTNDLPYMDGETYIVQEGGQVELP